MTTLVQEKEQSQPIALPLELILVLLLILLAGVLRLPQLDATPLADPEAREALAAQGHGYPENALGALVNAVSLLLLGASHSAARLGTALAGVALVLTPLLYRQWVGRSAALLLCLGLAISPVAVAASRTMSGMVWALLLLLVGGWMALRFYTTRQPNFALAATLCAAGVLFLTTPYGVLLLLGVACGLLWAAAAERRELGKLLAEGLRLESGLAALVLVVVVATRFFTLPSGLSSVAQIPENLIDSFSGGGVFYAFWVSLRYDFAFVVFGVLGAAFAWRENTFLERFLTGWFAWGVLVALLLPGASADLALLITLPALGLSISFVLRMLQTASYGFWQVPAWLIPLHMLIVAALLVSLGTNLQSALEKIRLEAEPVAYAEVLEVPGINGNNVRIGTLDPATDYTSMAVGLPYVRLENCAFEIGERSQENVERDNKGRYCDKVAQPTYTVQIVPIDRAAQDATLTIRRLDGDVLVEGQRVGKKLKITFQADTPGDYRFELYRPDDLTQRAQYLTLLAEGDLGGLGISNGTVLQRYTPRFYALLQMSLRNPNRVAVVMVLMLLLIIPITFFVVGALYGARAAWRGLAFGFLLYLAGYGLALGWGATVTYGGDGRELWNQQSVTGDYDTLRETLIEMSRRHNGESYQIPITVLGQADGALGWALRGFPHVRYVNSIAPDTQTPALLTPDTFPRPLVATDYVGQQLVFSYTWDHGTLNWTDLGAWLFSRRGRYAPQMGETWRLWISSEVYDVETIPADG